MNREHPTGTERKSLHFECGWKGGDRAAWLSGKRKNLLERVKKLLTRIGLLMEGTTFLCDEINAKKSVRVSVRIVEFSLIRRSALEKLVPI
jgi:hypothetical protein